jgi:HEAT repeat protein
MKTASTTLAVLLVLFLAAGSGLKAQETSYKNVTPNSIETLKNGITSTNTGLRKSSIYMAGLYKINETVNLLTEELKNEKDPGTKVLIALSLYNIGNPKGMEAVKRLAETDNDLKVRRMSTALYKTYTGSAEDISER